MQGVDRAPHAEYHIRTFQFQTFEVFKTPEVSLAGNEPVTFGADQPRSDGPAGGEEQYALRADPVARPMPDYVTRCMGRAEERMTSAAAEPPPPPRLPLFSGVFTFPFYPTSLAVWVFIASGTMISGYLLMFWINYGQVIGLLGARLFGPPTCAAAALTFGYAACCWMGIIEETSNGWDAIETWPDINWKEWIWNLAHLATLGLQAGIVGMAVQLAVGSRTWAPLLIGAWFAFPLVLLSALSADGAWVPLNTLPIVASMGRRLVSWIVFYVEITALAGAWIVLVTLGLWTAPWLVPLYAAPLLAAILLIYARLVGRLAAIIAELDEDDEDASEEEP